MLWKKEWMENKPEGDHYVTYLITEVRKERGDEMAAERKELWKEGVGDVRL